VLIVCLESAFNHTIPIHFNFLISHCTAKKRGLTLPLLLLRGAHFWWGQFEHSITCRPLPRIQLLARTSASLTLLPHWQVLVFGASAAAGVCSWAWGWGSSRCLFWPMVGDEGVGAVIVDAFLCVWLSLSHTITPTIHFNFSDLHCTAKKLHSLCNRLHMS